MHRSRIAQRGFKIVKTVLLGRLVIVGVYVGLAAEELRVSPISSVVERHARGVRWLLVRQTSSARPVAAPGHSGPVEIAITREAHNFRSRRDS